MRLSFVHFIGDADVNRPSDRREWEAALTVLHEALGLRGRIPRYVAEVFIDVRPSVPTNRLNREARIAGYQDVMPQVPVKFEATIPVGQAIVRSVKPIIPLSLPYFCLFPITWGICFSFKS